MIASDKCTAYSTFGCTGYARIKCGTLPRIEGLQFLREAAYFFGLYDISGIFEGGCCGCDMSQALQKGRE